MGKALTLLAFALLAACAVWAWISLRRYSAHKRLAEQRAAAFIAETMNAVKKAKPAPDKT